MVVKSSAPWLLLIASITTAFSRDQKKKVYVQHRIEQHSKEIWKWIKNGAYFYVCGDKEYMAKDVHKTLIKIAEKMDIPPNILSAAWDTNTLVRPEKDWEELKGRAVVDEKKA